MANEGSNDLIQFDGGALVADMVASAEASDALELSQYALEDGASINDHAVMQPKRLTLTLVQTESPLTTVQGFSRIAREIEYDAIRPGKQTNTLNVAKKEFRPTSLLALTSGVQDVLFKSAPIRVTGMQAAAFHGRTPLKVTVLAADADVGRVNEFHGQLIALLESVTPVQITVKQRQYNGMLITGVTRTDSAGQFGAARFTVTLQQVSTAETRIVELPPVPQATKKADKGKSDGKAPGEPKETELRSTLDRIGVSGLNALGIGASP